MFFKILHFAFHIDQKINHQAYFLVRVHFNFVSKNLKTYERDF